tara:strand:+ start:744 stop:1325 length:582 start_codon:yes stop_codon:yes gene_type:complete
MNDSEIFKADSDAKPNIEVEVAENDIEPVSDKPVKKERKKRVLSDERKAVLREQLKKGRQTSMLNRQKKSLANKLSKKEANDANDAILAESLLKRSKKDTPPAQLPSEPKPAKVAVPKQPEKSKESIELEMLKKEFADFKINFSGKSSSLDQTQSDVSEKEQPKPEIKIFTQPAAPPAQPKIAMMRRKRGTFN